MQEIARLAAAGMLRGGTDGRLNPNGLLTRAEGAAILARLDTSALASLGIIADYDDLIGDDIQDVPQDAEYDDDHHHPHVDDESYGDDDL